MAFRLRSQAAAAAKREEEERAAAALVKLDTCTSGLELRISIIHALNSYSWGLAAYPVACELIAIECEAPAVKE